MSDVVVSVVESNTAVTVTEQDVAVDVTENNVVVSVSTAGIQGVPGANNDPTYVTVRNATGATLLKGTIVYISGSNGNHVQVTPALATSDATSARTLGWLAESIANNASGLCQVEGYLEGLNTHGFTSGVQLYLSGTTAGAFTATKPQAPIHLVYVGVVTKVSSGDGHVFVKVQNGYELEELHNVQITNPTNAQVLAYDSATQLWKNATNTPDGVTSITATAPLTGGTITSTGSIGLDQSALSITKSQVSDFTSGTVTSASTAQQAGTAVYAMTSGTAVYATNSGTATYATTSGTAVFATNASTAVTISGNITPAQVTGIAVITTDSRLTDSRTPTGTAGGDLTGTYPNPTIAAGAIIDVDVNASANIAQSKISGLVSDLAGKANLAGGNAFTGAQTVTGTATGSIVQIIRGASGQANDFFSIQNSGGTALARANLNGSFFFGQTTGSYPTFFGASGSLAGMINVVPASAAVIPIIVRGAASQSANLQEWQNSAGTVLARIGADGSVVFAASNMSITATGAIFAGSLATNVGRIAMAEANSGGQLTVTRQTAAATNPGANIGRLYFRDGTTAGTLKLVVRAGAAGAETTILDNIPQ